MKGFVKIVFFIVALAIQYMAAAQAPPACNCGIPRDNTFQVVPMTLGFDTDIGVPPFYQNDNATTPAMALPFNFCFYGTNYDSVFISNNGIISFVKPIHAFIDSTQKFPLGADTIMIAPFYADVNTNYNRGVVYYKLTSTYMAVIWDSVRFAGTDVDGWNTFELIITNGTDAVVPDGNNVSFCYQVMQWACSEASGGFSGYNGTPAFMGVNKGDGVNFLQINTISKPGNFYFGPFSTYNGIDWMDYNSFTFNTCVTDNVIGPVILNSKPVCSALYICPCDTQQGESAFGLTSHCDTVTMSAAFICARPGQNAVLSYSCTGALNIDSVYISTASVIDSIVIQAIPAEGDTGVHILSLVATDTVNHVSSTVNYMIDVTNQCLTAGVSEPVSKYAFSVYPNPAGGHISIESDGSWGASVVKICDVFGNEVLSGITAPGKSDIDVSRFSHGMYFVALLNGGLPVMVRKIIIQ